MNREMCGADECLGFRVSMVMAMLCVAILSGRARAAGNAAGEKETGLEEIIVTAEKRESTVQATPIAMTALSAGDLAQENITSIQDLVGAIPGISLRTAGPGQTEYEMRGLGPTEDTAYFRETLGSYEFDQQARGAHQRQYGLRLAATHHHARLDQSAAHDWLSV